MSTSTIPVYLRAADAAAFLGVAVGTLNNWRAANVGPAYSKVGGTRVVYAVSDLEAFVAAGRVQTSAA